MDYFAAAIDWFSAQPFVRRGGIGMCGVCLGAQVEYFWTEEYWENDSDRPPQHAQGPTHHGQRVHQHADDDQVQSAFHRQSVLYNRGDDRILSTQWAARVHGWVGKGEDEE